MLQVSWFFLIATLFLVSAAFVSEVAALVTSRAARRAPEVALVGAGAPARHPTDELPEPSPSPALRSTGARYASGFTRLALVTLTISLVARTIATGHGPFANQYEFAVAFAWGMLAVFAYFDHRYQIHTLGLLVLPMSLAMMGYAISIGDAAVPLVPALQNSLLLTAHVAVAIVAYGGFAVSAGCAALYLLAPHVPSWRLPKPAVLEDIAYRAILIAFPLDTLVVILGALWADIAWGSYWSWDPKETASLFTWLIYGAYLHARVVRGWHGSRAMWLLMAGWGAVLLTFFGNLFLGGLHSYSGIG